MERDRYPSNAWPTPNKGGLKAEVAAAAAYLIAEEGLDYASAKRKAYARVTGGKGHRISKEALPS
ncbi:MAG: UDP-N-acetylmuramate--alanine ligase, partial [Burkholderiales bacterium]